MDEGAKKEYENRAAMVNRLAKRLADFDITDDGVWAIQMVPAVTEILHGGHNLGPVMVFNLLQTIGTLFERTESHEELLGMTIAFTEGHSAMVKMIDERMARASNTAIQEMKGHEQQEELNSRTTH